jgi:pilus assembly protein CpaE
MAVEYGSMPGSAYESVAAPARYDVAIVEPDGRRRLRLGTALSTAAQFDAVEELVQALRPGRPVVAVFGPGLAAPYGFQQVNRLIASYPDLGAIFAVEEVSTPLLQAAIRAGARDTVAVNDPVALVQSVQRVGELLAGTASRVPATTPARAAAGQLITVFSAKGGVGKSTVAINVAVAMAHRSVDRVALVDADLSFGDVAVLMGLPPQHTILDAISAAQYGDIELVRSMLVPHRSSGLLVLPAPTEPLLGAGVVPNDVVSVCQALQGMCGFVVVDLPSQLDDYAAALIEAADTVLLIGGMDIPSVKNLRIGMQVLDLGAIAGPKLRLVLNRSNTQVKLDVREIEQVLGLRADFPIPADIAVPISVNAGVPVVEQDPRGPASRALDRIAVSLLGPQPDRGKRRGRAKRERAALR